MFNFKVMNRALNDSNLSDKAFRMLYTITNYCSLKDSNSAEIHNEFFMDVLNVCERQIQRITNELVVNEYITKEVQSTPKKRIANKYTLLNVEVNDTPTDSLCTEASTQKFPLNSNDVIKRQNKATLLGDKNVTLKNNKKINNKITNTIANNINVSLPVEETEKLTEEVEVCDSDEQREEEKTNALTLEELLNSENVIEVNGKTINTYIPTTEALFIPDTDIEVCDSDEQSEEEITNAYTTNEITSTDNVFAIAEININENKQQMELRSADNITSTEEELVITDNINNEQTIYSNDICYKAPQPPTAPENDNNINENNDMMNEEIIDTNWSVSPTYNNAKFDERIKLINTAIENYKKTQDEQYRSLVNSHIKICEWMREANEISQKQMEWVYKIQSNFEKIVHGIYVSNKVKRNKAVLSHENNADNKSISRSDETQQDANKTANMRDYSTGEQNAFEELIKNGGKQSDLQNVVEYIKCNYNGCPAKKLEKLESFCNNTIFEGCTSAELIRELKDYITENIK